MVYLFVGFILLSHHSLVSTLTCLECISSNCLLRDNCKVTSNWSLNCKTICTRADALLNCATITKRVYNGNQVKDNCGCCNVCAKVEFEDCGGDYNIHGICDKGLECVKPVRTYPPVFSMSAGTCIKIPQNEEKGNEVKKDNNKATREITRRHASKLLHHFFR